MSTDEIWVGGSKLLEAIESKHKWITTDIVAHSFASFRSVWAERR